jgi:hypothetical protein
MAEGISLLMEDEDDNALDDDEKRVAHTTVPALLYQMAKYFGRIS